MAKSNKQRRAELQAMAARREARRAAAAKLDAQERGLAVDRSALAPDNDYGVPEFVRRGYYVDLHFTCQQCGEPQVWTAQQQKWWYETAKGGIWTTARLCRPCRKREQARRDEARRVHMEGLARKRSERESTE